jgi:hypothetical protein
MFFYQYIITIVIFLGFQALLYYLWIRNQDQRYKWWRYTWESDRWRPSVREVDRLIALMEDRSGVRLTRGARDMIVIPIEEAFELRGEISGELEQSLLVIFETLVSNPDARDRERRVRSSLSVIRAYAERFCNIPPFCDRKG